MIDTDKYKGYTNDYIWTWKHYASHFDHDADRALIQDAPLLLAEVKRLREAALKAREVLMKHYEWMSVNDATSEEDDQEILDTVKQLREASE